MQENPYRRQLNKMKVAPEPTVLSPEPKQPRLTKKGGRSREAIKDAAREVFREKGYAQARVQDIVQTAGFSAGAFYRYFKDKHEVMTLLMQDLLTNAFQITMASDHVIPLEEQVNLGTRHYLEYYAANADLFRILVEVAQVDPEIEQLWAEIRIATIQRLNRALDRAAASEKYASAVDRGLAAALLVTMTDHYAYLWLVLKRVDPRPLDEVCDAITSIWLHGVMASLRSRCYGYIYRAQGY
jgi:AcrR family transcriptional regulator